MHRKRELQRFAKGVLSNEQIHRWNSKRRMRNDWNAAGQIILRIPPELGLTCILNSQDGEPSVHPELWVESSE